MLGICINKIKARSLLDLRNELKVRNVNKSGG